MKLLIAPLLLSAVFASPDSKAGKFPKAKAAKAKSYGSMCMSTSSSMSMSLGPEPPITPSPTPAPTTSGVFLSARGGVSFGEEFNSLKVEGSTALAIIRGGSLDASNSEEMGLVVRDNGSAYVCKADLINGGTYSNFLGDGLTGVLLSDRFNDPAGDNPKIYVVNARIKGGNADVTKANGFGGTGLVVNRGRAEIVGKETTIVGGLNGPPLETSRWVAIDNGSSGNLYVYEGNIGDTMTSSSLTNFGFAYIYGGKWMGSWRIAGPTNVYGTNLVFDDINNNLTGTLCDGNEIDVQIIPQGGDLNLFQEQDSCSQYEDVTNTLPYSECE